MIDQSILSFARRFECPFRGRHLRTVNIRWPKALNPLRPDPKRPVGRLGPEVRMRRIFEVLRRVTARRSENEVLVLIVEDPDAPSRTWVERCC